MKSLLKKLSLILIITFYVTAAFAKTAPLQHLTLILDWFANPDHAPIFVAQQQHYFKQEGLQVEIIPPADPNDPPKLVADGKADIAITYQPQFILQKKQHLPLVQVGTLIATPLDTLVVLKNSNIKSIADLKGKRIGYSTAGIDQAILTRMLKRHGVSIKDVQMINVHYGLTQALLTHRIDAATGMFRNFELIQMQLTGNPGRGFYPEENGVPPYSELIFIANKKEAHSSKIKRFMKAVALGVQYLVNHPKQTWQVFAKNHPALNNELNRKAWFATLDRFALRPKMIDQQRLKNLTQFFQ